MVITTGSDPLPETQQRARDYAAKLGVTYVERGRYSVAGVSKQAGGCSVLVVLQQEIRLYQPDTEMMTFHPSMAFVRAKRLFKGVPDVMLQAAGIQAGDHVLDCTAGLGADSMMFAVGVGESGKVIAVEDSEELAALLYTGLSTYTSRDRGGCGRRSRCQAWTPSSSPSPTTSSRSITVWWVSADAIAPHSSPRATRSRPRSPT